MRDAHPHEDDAGGTQLDVSVVTRDGRVDVHVGGDIDILTHAAFTSLLELVCGLADHVRVDLSAVEFLDPRGASALARHQAAHPRLEISAASPAVCRIVEILGQLEGVGDVPRLCGGCAYDSPVI
jgi:anti-anti-sigma regulatory factor